MRILSKLNYLTNVANVKNTVVPRVKCLEVTYTDVIYMTIREIDVSMLRPTNIKCKVNSDVLFLLSSNC